MAAKKAKVEDLLPLYLIYGEEDLLLDHALRRLRDRIAEVADLDFNYEAFSGESADALAVVAAANTLPFASERRLVVVRDVDKMNAQNQAVLAEYAKDPAPSACLVLVAHKMRKDSKLLKAVAASGWAFEYKAPTRAEYPARVVDIFATKGRTISLDAASALVRAVGRDLRHLDTEADKIVAYVGERTNVTRGDVEAMVIQTSPPSVFDFTNALGSRQCARALEVLNELLAEGEEPHGVSAMAVRHIRTLISVRAVIDRGGSKVDVQRDVGMAEWQARTAIEQARNFTPHELSRALGDAAAMDAKMKTGRGEPRVLFEQWTIALCKRA